MSANIRTLKLQLLSIKASAEAALALLDEVAPAQAGPCEHKNLEDASTMGVKRSICRDCGEVLEGGSE